MAAATADGPAYYAVWKSETEADLQMIVNTKMRASPSDLGFEWSPVMARFLAQEGDTVVQVIGPTSDLVRTAVSLLRPGAELE